MKTVINEAVTQLFQYHCKIVFKFQLNHRSERAASEMLCQVRKCSSFFVVFE